MIHMYFRYGGLSFGKVQMEINVNLTIIQEALQRLSTAANNGRPVIYGNESFWDDLSQLITDLQPTGNYAKVSFLTQFWGHGSSFDKVLFCFLRFNIWKVLCHADGHCFFLTVSAQIFSLLNIFSKYDPM